MITKNFLVSVTPLTSIPLMRDQSFFYLSKGAPIPTGSLVEIPIGKRTTKGVVTECHEDFERASGITLKFVGKVLQREFVSVEQLELAKFICSYYYAPLGIVLKSCVPDRVAARTPHNPETLSTFAPLTVNAQTKKSVQSVEDLLSRSKSAILQTTHSSEYKQALLTLLENSLNEHDGQILILVPERTHIPMMQRTLTAIFPGSIVTTLSSTMTKGAFYESWERVRARASQDVRIVIGTRGAIFAPFYNLNLVVITESHDAAYKQWDKTPRYDARKCAEVLAEIHSSNIISMSACPQITTEKDLTKIVTLPEMRKPRISIVDMKIEYNDVNEKKFTKQHPTLSRTLISELLSTFSSGNQSLMFINHQGKNAFTVCTKCKTVARCPTCERALIESRNGNHTCLHCSFKTPIFPSCTSCRALTFQTIGIGTERVASEIQKILPRARVAIVDSETMKKRTTYDKLYNDSVSGNIDIVIGTQMATKGWSLPRLSTAAIIDMDTLLGGTDYDTHERAYGHILQLSTGLTNSTAYRKNLVIQSYDTIHEVLLAATQKDLIGWHEFIDAERSMREILYFPPCASLIKLVHQSTFKKETQQEIEKLYERLLLACGDNQDIKISSPHEPLVAKIRTKYRMQIVVTLKGVSNVPNTLHDILLGLDKSWIIDRDPVHLA